MHNTSSAKKSGGEYLFGVRIGLQVERLQRYSAVLAAGKHDLPYAFRFCNSLLSCVSVTNIPGLPILVTQRQLSDRVRAVALAEQDPFNPAASQSQTSATALSL